MAAGCSGASALAVGEFDTASCPACERIARGGYTPCAGRLGPCPIVCGRVALDCLHRTDCGHASLPGVRRPTERGERLNGANLLPDKPPRKLVWSLGWRSGLVQTFFSHQRMQGIGVGWALLPVLQRWSRSDDEFRRKAERHFAYYNGNPYLASFTLGAIARLEAEGEGERAPGMKQRMMPITGALGDRLFWHHLRPMILAGCTILLLTLPLNDTVVTLVPAVALFLFGFISWSFRFSGIRFGWRHGKDTPYALSRLNLLRRSGFLGYIGAMIAGVVVSAGILQVTTGSGLSIEVNPSVLASIAAGLLLGRRATPVWVVLIILVVVVLEAVMMSRTTVATGVF
ncbi:hypothetical protein GF324_00425 [bacterium]|nr:hypothetical protein [bacterium]